MTISYVLKNLFEVVIEWYILQNMSWMELVGESFIAYASLLIFCLFVLLITERDFLEFPGVCKYLFTSTFNSFILYFMC